MNPDTSDNYSNLDPSTQESIDYIKSLEMLTSDQKQAAIDELVASVSTIQPITPLQPVAKVEDFNEKEYLSKGKYTVKSISELKKQDEVVANANEIKMAGEKVEELAAQAEELSVAAEREPENEILQKQNELAQEELIEAIRAEENLVGDIVKDENGKYLDESLSVAASYGIDQEIVDKALPAIEVTASLSKLNNEKLENRIKNIINDVEAKVAGVINSVVDLIANGNLEEARSKLDELRSNIGNNFGLFGIIADLEKEIEKREEREAISA